MEQQNGSINLDTAGEAAAAAMAEVTILSLLPVAYRLKRSPEKEESLEVKLNGFMAGLYFGDHHKSVSQSQF